MKKDNSENKNNNQKNNGSTQKSRLAIIFAASVMGAILASTLPDNNEDNEVSYGELLEQATQGQVSEITLRGREITATLKEENKEVTSYVPAEENAFERFNDKGVNVTAKPIEKGGFASFLLPLAPSLLLLAPLYT